MARKRKPAHRFTHNVLTPDTLVRRGSTVFARQGDIEEPLAYVTGADWEWSGLLTTTMMREHVDILIASGTRERKV